MKIGKYNIDILEKNFGGNKMEKEIQDKLVDIISNLKTEFPIVADEFDKILPIIKEMQESDDPIIIFTRELSAMNKKTAFAFGLVLDAQRHI